MNYAAAVRPQGRKGQPQLKKDQAISIEATRETLDSAISELSNAISNLRDSHNGRLSGVALSAELGALYALEAIEYLRRKI